MKVKFASSSMRLRIRNQIIGLTCEASHCMNMKPALQENTQNKMDRYNDKRAHHGN